MWGVGAALSNILAGWIVVAAGYTAAFVSWAVVAAAGLALDAVAVPETAPEAAVRSASAEAGALPQMGEATR